VQSRRKKIALYVPVLQLPPLTIHRVFTNNEEDFATHYVRLLGCEVISRNSRMYGAEIDILCRGRDRSEYLVFEVKRRRNAAHSAYPAVSHAQLLRLKKAAEQLQVSADRLLTIRICLLLVDLQQGSIELIPDVLGLL
jgi:Holliday junction resolvase-like predicted endonuclease